MVGGGQGDSVRIAIPRPVRISDCVFRLEYRQSSVLELPGIDSWVVRLRNWLRSRFASKKGALR